MKLTHLLTARLTSAIVIAAKANHNTIVFFFGFVDHGTEGITHRFTVFGFAAGLNHVN
jgi:hypothetical protein